MTISRSGFRINVVLLIILTAVAIVSTIIMEGDFIKSLGLILLASSCVMVSFIATITKKESNMFIWVNCIALSLVWAAAVEGFSAGKPTTYSMILAMCGVSMIITYFATGVSTQSRSTR